jgi:octaprenyl-diphosphate synthase
VEVSKVLEPIVEEMAAVERELGAVAARIVSSESARSGILEQISRHPFAVPGKRLRPALVLLSSLAGEDASRVRGAAEPREGRQRAAAIRLATAVEILHAASLVHDDIIDGADLRRHQVSLNKRYGNRVAVLAGDILYTEFFSLISELPVDAALRSRLLSLFLETTKRMCIGEILAQEAEASRESLEFEEYLVISEDKTASLFAACCAGGALVGGCSEEGVRRLSDFGLLFGLTFQMLDDLADRDHGLDPGIDLRSRTEGYALRTRAAAASFGASSAELSALLDSVLAQALSS